MGEQAQPAGEFRQRAWKRFIKGPDPSLLEDLYVPMLTGAVRYDRCCAYFSSSVLSAAARGFARLIERLEQMGEHAPRPAVRLVVNEELSANDVRALTEAGDLSELEALLQRRFRSPKDLLAKRRLEMLAWLVKRGLLEVRVGVMRSGGGVVHAKFGLTSDAAGDAVVFSGSGNESAHGLVANYERLEVSTSWEDRTRYEEYRQEFEALWGDTHPTVHTISLPEALRERLIKLAPEEPPVEEPSNAAARQKAAMVWQFLLEAPYFQDGGATCDATAMVDLWPHQRRVVEESASAWPAGRLLCDEVGMGKTIEAILVLRRLLAGRGVRRALTLLPAGLLPQWQTELREKGGLLFPRLEGLNVLVWPDGVAQKVEGLSEALRQNVLLLSRETARTENNLAILLGAEPWDLVLLDEAHAARRRRQEEGEFNSGTQLLSLLRQLQLQRKTRGILLLSATPMQTQPWEPWDLLSVLGEGGTWLADFGKVREFYAAIAAVKSGFCGLEQAAQAAELIAGDADFPLPADLTRPAGKDRVARLLAFVPAADRVGRADWLRRGSPLGRRMHRNTRHTLRGYHAQGLLPAPPPVRVVDDRPFDFTDAAERRVYDRVAAYIDKRFAELEQEKPGKGFVMTVYRRRASSSPQALECSLLRRRDLLWRMVRSQAVDTYLPDRDVPEALDPSEMPEGETALRPSAALPLTVASARAEFDEVEDLLRELRALAPRDSKRDFFFNELRRITADGRAVLVFTEYVDTMEYLRDVLLPHYPIALACYSGAGGQIRDGDQWKLVEKAEITRALQERRLQVLVCTDAASEGLNLQSAGAVIDYDLPWNPSKVEQRIGRIDRIGQKHETVRVVNLFLERSVDDQVYRALRLRCGLFEHFVGAMQPVLARAQRMLRGEEPIDIGALQVAAEQIEHDPLAGETYLESPPAPLAPARPAFDREGLERGLDYLREEIGFRCRLDSATGVCTISSASFGKARMSSHAEALEADRGILPLTPLSPRLRELSSVLTRPGECLPLVIGSYQHGAFRTSVVWWLEGGNRIPITSLNQLEERLESWDGRLHEPAVWRDAEAVARDQARIIVEAMAVEAEQREATALARQLEAARLRLLRELGHYLACLGEGTGDLNGTLYRWTKQDTASAVRLKQCLDRLDGWPQWTEELRYDLDEFVRDLPENRRKARLLGAELDAALEDPRWAAAQRSD